MRRMIGKIIVGVLFLNKGFSQTIELDPATITASLIQKRSSETGRNIISIKGELFNKLPVNSIDELLRYLPGIEVQMRGPQGSQSDILLRGGTFQQVLVILDGVRLNDPLTGHFTSYIPIAPSEIDRIEILKGASSAIYGSDAVGGVINIISKTYSASFDNLRATTKQLGGRVATGEFGLLNATAGGYWQNRNTAVSAGMITNNADGQQQRGIKGFFHNTTVSASAKHFFNEKWSIALRSAYDRRNFAAQNFYTAFTSDTATEQVTTFWNQLQLQYKKKADKLTFSFGYKNAEDEYAFNTSGISNINKSKLLQALVVNEHQFARRTTLVSGAQFQNRIIRSNDRGNHSVKQAAAFVTLNQTIRTFFFISPALRLNWDEKGGIELLPQINLSYKTGNFQIRGSAGKTIRDADFTERYNNYNKALVTSGNIGNTDLEAEHSWSYEAGADYFLSNTLKISATFFTKYYSQLIDWVNTPYANMPRKVNLSPGGNYFLASNISKLTTSGVETDIQFSKSINSKHSIFSTIGVVIINNSSTPSLYIASSAKFLFNYSFIYTYKWLQLGASGVYKQRPEQKGNAALIPLSKDYFVCNFRLDGMVIKNKLSLFAQVDNALNRNYADRFGVPMPGRWWMGGLKFAFNR